MKTPLVLWGGVDVDSNYYHQPRSSFAQYPDIIRDKAEFAYVKRSITQGIPVIGVCRGAQLLCVANGGSLYQHSEPTRQDHSIQCKDGEFFETVCAGHHQIMRPVGNYIVYAFNPNYVRVWHPPREEYTEEDRQFNKNNSSGIKDTAEVVWFPDTKCLAIQPHPEWARKNDPFVAWINSLMNKLEIDYEF